MAGKMRFDDKGFSLIELMIVIAIVVVLSFIFFKNFSTSYRGRSIEKDTRTINAFLQKMRMEAFSKKKNLNIAISNNGTRLCETNGNICIQLDNPFSSSSNVTINERGLYSSGNIHLNRVSSDASYSCVVYKVTRVRKGKWDGTNCNAL